MIGDKLLLRRLKLAGAPLLVLSLILSGTLFSMAQAPTVALPNPADMKAIADQLAHSTVNELLAHAVVYLVWGVIVLVGIIIWIILAGPVAKMITLNTELLVQNKQLTHAIAWCQMHSGKEAADVKREVEDRRRKAQEPP